MTDTDAAFLADIDVFFFDVFGTVLDWLDSVPARLQELNTDAPDVDWTRLATDWRAAYWAMLQTLAAADAPPTGVDILHREALDALLATPAWAHLAARWDDARRAQAVAAWHRVDAWPDAVPALHALKKHAVIGTLANGSVRQFVDIAKHAHLPWDVVLTGELLGAYKPNPAVYRAAARLLAAPPARCCMVAAHAYDVRAAAALGLRSVYVRRATEDGDVVGGATIRDGVKVKSAGGDVDLVVDGLAELARAVERARGARGLA